MTKDLPNEPLDRLEQALLELRQAETAGVFRSTPFLDAKGVSSRPSPTVRVFSVRGLAVAAMLIMVVGVWTMMFRSQIASIRGRSISTVAERMSEPSTMHASIAHCLAGPTGAIGTACVTVDFDGDGDVDLGDVSAFQRSYVAVSQ